MDPLLFGVLTAYKFVSSAWVSKSTEFEEIKRDFAKQMIQMFSSPWEQRQWDCQQYCDKPIPVSSLLKFKNIVNIQKLSESTFTDEKIRKIIY